MSKKVKLKIVINEEGQIHVEPEGTEGSECVQLMEFLKHIHGMTVLNYQRTDPDDGLKPQSNINVKL